MDRGSKAKGTETPPQGGILGVPRRTLGVHNKSSVLNEEHLRLVLHNKYDREVVSKI